MVTAVQGVHSILAHTTRAVRLTVAAAATLVSAHWHGAGAEPAATTPRPGLTPTLAPASVRSSRPELPRGGHVLFPGHRLVGFCGTPGEPELGKLSGNLTANVKTLEAQADEYDGRKVLPVVELIAVVVRGAPGEDGKWRRRVADSVVDEYLQAARKANALLQLNIQPGHSDFLTEAKHFDRYLHQPDVGLSLDLEWAMKMKGAKKPGAVFGGTSAAKINEIADYLSSIVKAGDLPEKALVFHQVTGRVLKDESDLVRHPGVVLIKSVDGIGPKSAKLKTYHSLTEAMPRSIHPGVKLFFDEDTRNGGRLMTPDEVMSLRPEPEYVMYE